MFGIGVVGYRIEPQSFNSGMGAAPIEAAGFTFSNGGLSYC